MYWVGSLLDVFEFLTNNQLRLVCNTYYIVFDIDSARDEYFARNFAWHAITQYSGELTCSCKNATIIFIKPVPDQLAKDRLGLMV